METVINTDVIRRFLTEVGRRYEQPDRLYVLGGSALRLLGSARPTLDLDYFGNDMQKNDLQMVIDQVATEMQIEVEAVPLDEFILIPQEASERHRFVARSWIRCRHRRCRIPIEKWDNRSRRPGEHCNTGFIKLAWV